MDDGVEMNRNFGDTSIDRVRDYWNRRPCNVRHSPAPQGTRSYFDQVEERKYLVEPHIPRFAQFDRWSGKRVLEIGCGIGTDTMNFARAGASVTADGKDIPFTKLEKGMKIDAYVEHSRWGLYASPDGKMLTLLDRKAL